MLTGGESGHGGTQKPLVAKGSSGALSTCDFATTENGSKSLTFLVDVMLSLELEEILLKHTSV